MAAFWRSAIPNPPDGHPLPQKVGEVRLISAVMMADFEGSATQKFEDGRFRGSTLAEVPRFLG
jgi:hypothetical protein